MGDLDHSLKKKKKWLSTINEEGSWEAVFKSPAWNYLCVGGGLWVISVGGTWWGLFSVAVGVWGLFTWNGKEEQARRKFRAIQRITRDTIDKDLTPTYRIFPSGIEVELTGKHTPDSDQLSALAQHLERDISHKGYGSYTFGVTGESITITRLLIVDTGDES